MKNENNNPLVNSIVKALAYTENGGKPDISNPLAGQTGEMKSIFQFEPATWKADAGKILGNPNAPLTADNETYVVQQKVGNWIKKGYNANQIASMWNAGVGEPDAYTGKFSDGSSSQGVNKQYGVKYDVPGYAKKVVNYAKQFYNQSSSKQGQNQQPAISPTPQVNNALNSSTNASKPIQKKGLMQGIGQKSVMPALSMG